MPDAPESVTDLFRIDWDRHSAAQWQTMLDNCARPTLTQSPAYAAAVTEVDGIAADYGLIRFQGKPIGMTIVTRRRGLAGVANCSLYRGPLWIYDEIPGQMLKLALRQFRNRRPSRVAIHQEFARIEPFVTAGEPDETFAAAIDRLREAVEI